MKKNNFLNTKLASKIYPMSFNEVEYLERTRRNQFWVGHKEGQLKLHDLKIGVAGLGGMGSNIAEILVRLGVGHIKIADYDIIEKSNLNRQVIANSKTVGLKKAVASAQELRAISEDFELIVYEDGITQENVSEFVSDLDAIVDEIDVFPLRPHVWLHKVAQTHKIPIYSGYIIGMGAHIYKFKGLEYTFMDFMQNNESQIDTPSAEFMLDRFVNPMPEYLKPQLQKEMFLETLRNGTVPIFGASTYMAQSMLSIRMISDLLQMPKVWEGIETPIMPEFIKIDPYSLSLKICNINKTQ